MAEIIEALNQKIQELETEIKRLSGILKEHGLLEEKNEDYPLHAIWYESGKYAGV